ncbi:MAG: GIY-YIG nuclease family protein [Legionellales bacterium]|nr:GIY-YIG nuclease family protein [Legionellales bacterium]
MIEFKKDNFVGFLNVSGIYYIKIAEKDYVGSAVSIGHRLKHHLWALKSQRHHNRTMQNAWNKYKVAEFKMLEACDKDILIDKELYYITKLSPYMNHILNPVKIIRDETYKQRLSDGLKKAYANGLEPHNKQEVHMYDLSGNYLKSFDSITEASQEFNTDPSGICAALNGRAYSAQKHLWSTSKLDKIKIPKKNYQVRSVVQYDMNNVKLREWESVKIAEQTLSISNIHRAARNNRTAGGFKWKFE